MGCVEPIQQVGCPEDARMCDDGTMVVRVPPECKFEKCPVIEKKLVPTLNPDLIPVQPSRIPTSHECMQITDESLANAIEISECFLENNQVVDCTYFMLKTARNTEKEKGIGSAWAMRLYSKSMDCAKEAEKQYGDAVPPQMSVQIFDYYNWMATDALALATQEDMDEIIIELEKLY